MKLVVIFSVFIASNAIPLNVPLDNSHYVAGESRFIWIGDGKGSPHLVDLEATVDPELLMTRNGANNQYWLYTRSNPNVHQLLVHGDEESVKSSAYLDTRPLKVIVHGWMNNGDSHMNKDITAAFLAVSDCNVIVVDWRSLANRINYLAVAAASPDVGRHLGDFLTWLIDTAGGDWRQVHLVGFSLGAHIVGNAGRQTGGKPQRITGLDPAGLTWYNNPLALNADCGEYVEGIHTDGQLAGIMQPVGDVDFYPNGGKNPQPGCLTSFCSHGRSTELFAASVRYNHLVGRTCPNIYDAELGNCNGLELEMGNSDLQKIGKGIYGLRTNRQWPF